MAASRSAEEATTLVRSVSDPWVQVAVVFGSRDPGWGPLRLPSTTRGSR